MLWGGEQEIRIFYSWQSDLPNNKTRNLIQGAIDSATKSFKGVVSINADRDTKGEYGSPDITKTIFSKIDDCDIFIADISIINKHYVHSIIRKIKKREKLTPNPNVLLELGYAARVVGWDNIICVMNTDYGEIDELPFDLRQHRIKSYSSRENNVKIKKDIQSIIVDTVNNLLANGKRPKERYTDLHVGSYIFNQSELSKNLLPFSPRDFFSQEYKNSIQDECMTLINEINEIHLAPRNEDESKNNVTNTFQSNGLSLFNNNDIEFININDDIKNTITNYVSDNTDVFVGADFFELGNLKHKKIYHIADFGPYYDGTKDEINKYGKIKELFDKISRLELFERYVQTFDNYLLFPLAIKNKSTLKDENITINVFLPDSVSAIVPSKNIIINELKGMEGTIYENEFIKELLLMEENDEIKYDENISDSFPDPTYQFKASGINGAHFDEDDYEKELMKYIASPSNKQCNCYEFHINSLRANECCWVGPLIMIKTCFEDVEIKYTIKSNYSDGTLAGVIIINAK